jgi:hypothetical protein
MASGMTILSAINDISELDDAASKLCRSCGLCCDGTLFSFVPVHDTDNLQRLQAAGIKLIAHDEQSKFEQPCSAHTGQCCRLYGDRPANCRKFRCKLLIECHQQKKSWLEAEQKIKQVYSLRTKLLEALLNTDLASPGISLPELWKRWEAASSGTEGLAFRRKYGQVLIETMAFRQYLQQHFLEKNVQGHKHDIGDKIQPLS